MSSLAPYSLIIATFERPDDLAITFAGMAGARQVVIPGVAERVCVRRSRVTEFGARQVEPHDAATVEVHRESRHVE